MTRASWDKIPTFVMFLWLPSPAKRLLRSCWHATRPCCGKGKLPQTLDLFPHCDASCNAQDTSSRPPGMTHLLFLNSVLNEWPTWYPQYAKVFGRANLNGDWLRILTATPTKLDPTWGWDATLRWAELAVWSELNFIFSPFSKLLSFCHFSKKSDLAFSSTALVTRLIAAKKAMALFCFMALGGLRTKGSTTESPCWHVLVRVWILLNGDRSLLCLWLGTALAIHVLIVNPSSGSHTW